MPLTLCYRKTLSQNFTHSLKASRVFKFKALSNLVGQQTAAKPNPPLVKMHFLPLCESDEKAVVENGKQIKTSAI